jgi:peptide/nickel transport system permease protein
MRTQNCKKTRISLGILLVLLISSVLYDFAGPEDYRTMINQLYDDNGKVIENPPYPPNKEYPLGTDRDGRDNLLLIIDGLKYTFAAVLVVSFMRVVIGSLLGIIVETWIPACKSMFKAFFLPFHYVPLLLIGVLLMDPVIFLYNDIPIMVKIEFQLIVLFLLGFPTVFFFTTDFVNEIKSKSYVMSSYLLGGSKLHIILKQILPHLKPQLIIMFVQQVLQTLQILMGLAMFTLFLGGPHKEKIYNTPYNKSVTNELAGLTGQNFWTLKNDPWVAFSSLGMLLVIFILVIVIKNELVANMEGKMEQYSVSSSKNKVELNKEPVKREISPGEFNHIQQKVLDQ